MNILYLEDRASIFQPLKDKLESQGHKVFKAIQISDAIGYLHEKEIEFLIIDLRVLPTGLKQEEIKKSFAGRISGWIFLENYAFKKCPDFKKRTVVFSEYIYQLEKCIDLNKYPDVTFFSKKESSIDKVYEFIINTIQK